MKIIMMIVTGVYFAIEFNQPFLAGGIVMGFFTVEEIIIQSKRFK